MDLLPRKPLCLQISFHSKYFTQRATRSTVGVAGVHFGANEVLVVAGYFRERVASNASRQRKSEPVSFVSLIRESEARKVSPLLYSFDFCLTGENKFQEVWG